MRKINYMAIIVAVIVAFVLSTVYYIIFGETRAELLGLDPATAQEAPRVSVIVGELLRTLVIALVIAYFAARLGAASLKAALGLGLVLWIGFPATLLWGSVMWDNVPGQLAIIHSGDWLIKLLVVSAIVSVWSGKRQTAQVHG